MILQAEITKKGTLHAKIIKSLWGKKIVVSGDRAGAVKLGENFSRIGKS